ncbi:MAG: hypothetical protein RTU63_06845 [Candidatus Thorarchaeota archaeon]
MYGENTATNESPSIRFTQIVSMIFIIIGILGFLPLILFYGISPMMFTPEAYIYWYFGGGYIILGLALHFASADDTLSIVFETIGLIGAFVTVVYWIQHVRFMAWFSFVLIVVCFGALCQRTYEWSNPGWD